ncbi:MAG: RIP metalloprotease RseP, partial [Calditrichaeota bacterium]
IGYMSEGGVSEKAGLQIGDQILEIKGQPVNSWNEIRDRYFSNLGNQIVMTVRRDNTEKEIVFGSDILQKENAQQLDLSPRLPATVGDVVSGAPASDAGLQRGDQILSINDTEINSWGEMTDIIEGNPNKPLEFKISRNGEILIKEVTPEPTGQLSEDKTEKIVGKIGIGFYYERKDLSFFPALAEGFSKTIFISEISVKGLWWLVTGKTSAKEMLGGPIMITKMAGDFAKSGFSSLMELIANLSIMLALINILPVPALDGGHIAIVIIEEIRRKPLTTRTKLKIQQIGMAILLVLIVFVMYNDIMRLL